MGNKIKTIALLLVVGFLLASTLYISYLLRSESKSAPTTIKKTKAAALTYSKSVSINSFSPTATKIPSPTNAFSIAGSMMTSISPTAVVPTSLTPTASLLASVSPTEVLLAQITSTPIPSAVSTATTTRAQTLPETGWIKPVHIMFIFAFSLIIFSLIF